MEVYDETGAYRNGAFTTFPDYLLSIEKELNFNDKKYTDPGISDR